MRYIILTTLFILCVFSDFYNNSLVAGMKDEITLGVYSKAEKLHIRIDEVNLQVIKSFQEKSRKENFYLPMKKDSVAAQITLDGGVEFRSKIRLRNRWEEAQNIHEWALRVSVKDDGSVLGMRKFMLKPGGSRWDYRESLLALHLRSSGVIAPRVLPIQLYINDKFIAPMVIEEIFTKEMLESNRKKDNPIVGFNNRPHREQIAQNILHGASIFSKNSGSMRSTQFTGPKSPFDETLGFFFAPIGVVSLKRSLKKFGHQTQFAAGILRGYRSGKLSFDHAFDAKSVARYLAIKNLWKSYDGFSWQDVTFYYNAFSKYLEPIGHVSTKRTAKGRISEIPYIFRLAMGSKVFLEEYNSFSKKITSSDYVNDLMEEIKRWEKNNSTFISKNKKFSSAYFDLRIGRLSRNEATSSVQKPAQTDFSKVLLPIVARRVRKGKHEIISFQNISGRKLMISKIEVQNKGEKPVYIPIHVESLSDESENDRKQVIISNKVILPKSEVFVFVSNEIGTPLKKISVERSYPIVSDKMFEARESAPQSKRYLLVDEKNKALSIKPGIWSISESLIVPVGYSLRILAGTTLKFSGKSGIYLRGGDLKVLGDSNDPVFLTSNGNGWQGIKIIGGSLSRIEHARIDDIQRSNGKSGITGAVFVWETKLVIKNSELSENQTEDLVNVVDSELLVENSMFYSTTSDAIDMDFSVGKIVNSEFKEIGGDAIDVSGAHLIVESVKLTQVKDKAISIGEKSIFFGNRIEVNSVGTGIASKDGSISKIQDSSFHAVEGYSFMSYVKKNEYGPATLRATRVSGERNSASVSPSKVYIEGELQEDRDMDIKKMYSSGSMKK